MFSDNKNVIMIISSLFMMVLAISDGIDALKGAGSSFRTVIITLLRVKFTVDVTNNDGFNIDLT